MEMELGKISNGVGEVLLGLILIAIKFLYKTMPLAEEVVEHLLQREMGKDFVNA